MRDYSVTDGLQVVREAIDLMNERGLQVKEAIEAVLLQRRLSVPPSVAMHLTDAVNAMRRLLYPEETA